MDYVFETIRIKNRNIEFFDCHIRRLLKTAEIKKFKLPGNERLTEESIFFLRKHIKDEQIYKFNIFLYSSGIYDFKVSLYEKNESRKLYLCDSHIRNSGTEYHKDNDYMKLFLEYKPAFSKDCQDIIMLNEKNNISECITSNIFFIEDGTIITPPENDGLFKGIIREKIIEICRKNQYKIKTISVPIEYIDKFDGCFITNSLKGVKTIYEIQYNNIIKKYYQNPAINNLKMLLSDYIYCGTSF